MKPHRLEWDDLFTPSPQWSNRPIKERQRWQRAAVSFLAFVRNGCATVNAQAVHDWLLSRLSSHTVSDAMADLRGLGHMLRKPDAVIHWKRCQPLGVRRSLEALHRRVFLARPQQPGPIADLIPLFIRYCESQRRGNRAEEPLRRLDRFLLKCGIQSLTAIEPRTLTAYMATRHLSRRSCAIEVSALRSFFRWLRRTGRLQAEPEALLEVKGPFSRHRPYIYSVKELATLLDRVRQFGGWHGLTAFTMLHLIYACGLRVSEALRLRPGDLDLERCVLRIRKSKFGKSRQIPIGKRASEYLRIYAERRHRRLDGSPRHRRRAEEGGPFFVMPEGGAVRAVWLRDRFRRACNDTGLSRTGRRPRIHDLRHSFAVHRLYKWYADGVEPQSRLILLSIYMGHILVENTAHYLRMGQDLMRIASRHCARGLDDVLQAWRDAHEA